MPRGMVAIPVCLPHDVLRLWQERKDTRTIADELGVRESTVANMLPEVLERARHEREWEEHDGG